MPVHSKRLSMIAAALVLPFAAIAADTAPPEAKAEAKVVKKQALGCDETTSSRIRRDKNGKCVATAAPVRTYTKEDIERTGQTDVGEALKRLDPRFH